MKQKKRFWARLWTRIRLSKWTHCPVPGCQRGFARHELHGVNVLVNGHHYRYTCRECAGLPSKREIRALKKAQRLLT